MQLVFTKLQKINAQKENEIARHFFFQTRFLRLQIIWVLFHELLVSQIHVGNNTMAGTDTVLNTLHELYV